MRTVCWIALDSSNAILLGAFSTALMRTSCSQLQMHHSNHVCYRTQYVCHQNGGNYLSSSANSPFFREYDCSSRLRTPPYPSYYVCISWVNGQLSNRSRVRRSEQRSRMSLRAVGWSKGLRLWRRLVTISKRS
jgi:hypothetical protein